MVICDRCGTGKQYARLRPVTIIITGDTDFDSHEDQLPKTIVAHDLCRDCKDIVRDAFVKAMEPPAEPVKYTKDQVLNFLDQELEPNTANTLKEKFDEVMF